MEYFVLEDIGSMIQNEAIRRLLSPMMVRLCHLILSAERSDLSREAFASLEKPAEALAQASEEFVQIAKRLAGDSEEEWLREEMGPAADSLITSGRNIMLVAQKLRLQPECQSHREELVTSAQQILLDTTKVLLLEDAAAARTVARAAGRCLTCLDAVEAAGAGTPRGPWIDLAGALLSLGRLGARGPEGRLLRGRVPALLAALRAHPLSSPSAATRRRLFALAREILGELLERLERLERLEPGAPGTPACAAGALPRNLQQLHTLLAAPGPERLQGGLDSLLAAVLWPCMSLAAAAEAPERLRLVTLCRLLLQLRGLGPEEKRVALRAATEALSQGVRAGLLRQILSTFTDTQSPLQRLVQVALATAPVTGSSWCASEDLPESLQLLFAAFHEQAQQMLRVGHLVLVCSPRQQTGKDLEATMVGLTGLVVTVQRLFSQGPQGSGLNWSPLALHALLQGWARVSERLLACFDDVLSIPEFLSVSTQEMAKHLDFYTWTLRSGDTRQFPRLVAYLQGRAAHIVQVMNRYVDQHRDPIFRNGLRVLIQQVEQSSLVLGEAAERCSGGHSSQDTGTFLAVAKHLICAAQSLQEGLDGTNHPDILSPLRDQVQRFAMVKRQPCVLPSLQDSPAPELTHERRPGLGKSDPGTSYPLRDHLSSPLIPDTCTQSGSPPLSTISKPSCAGESRSHQAVSSASTNPQEWGVAVDEAQEFMPGEGPLGSERMDGLQEIPTLVASVADLAGKTTHCTAAGTNRLLKWSPQLSQRASDNRQGLAAMAGDWYPLCQQLFCHSPAADLPGSTAVFMELQQNLVSMAQLTAKSGPVGLGRKDPDSAGHPEALSHMQDRLEEAETHAEQLLDTVLTTDGLQAPISWKESFEDRCLLWSVAAQDLLRCMERLNRRQGQFLVPLRQAVKNQQGLQEGLAQVADVSQRLQEAAQLSRLLCGDAQVKGEVSFLCREIHVLTDALLDVAQILASSPRPSPSLSTRFELLCLELTLRAKALTGHLSGINADYGQALQDALCPRLCVYEDPQAPDLRPHRPESSLERMVSGIQAVQAIVAGGQESGPCQENLLVALEDILVLTKEVAQRVSVLQEHPEDGGLLIPDWLQWEWAAKAHHAVFQLQAWKGGLPKAWRLLARCLKPSDDKDPAQPWLHHGEGISGAAAVGSVDSQGAAPRDTPGSSAGTCTVGPAIAGTIAADLDMWPPCSTPPCTPGGLPWPCAEPGQPLQEDYGTDGGNRITQMAQDMAKEVLLMAQSLRRRGHFLTKEQLIASARKVATSGHNFTRLIRIMAKNCIDDRCSQELLCVVEQIQTMSNQLRIISSVKASLARSKSSEELLLGNAQQLLRAVSKTVRAAEAASLRGLRQLSSDPEELEVAALCMQWRRRLAHHRCRETSSLDCDELGLRKTGTNHPPAPPLEALVQEAL